jgi:hypothetical protein
VADSSSVSEAAVQVVRARPRKATVIARVSAAAVVVIFTAIGVALHGKTDSGTGVFGRSDQVAMIGLGILAGLGILMFTRPRMEADARGIRVRNLIDASAGPRSWAVDAGAQSCPP